MECGQPPLWKMGTKGECRLTWRLKIYVDGQSADRSGNQNVIRMAASHHSAETKGECGLIQMRTEWRYRLIQNGNHSEMRATGMRKPQMDADYLRRTGRSKGSGVQTGMRAKMAWKPRGYADEPS